MNTYTFTVKTVQDLDDWELDDLRDQLRDWFSPEDGEEFDLEVMEGDDDE